MTTLDRTFTATVHKNPNKGGRIYVPHRSANKPATPSPSTSTNGSHSPR